jgi:hypothetical protein
MGVHTRPAGQEDAVVPVGLFGRALSVLRVCRSVEP